ncbi:hypothetical protein V5O48_015806 [Marasmius crinis-equi]|uniref:Uncharacterized protein n=1 Tax=Marasmius crinis-equi TaxID=585013 RepID=A0ABR3ETG8_9AGAR
MLVPTPQQLLPYLKYHKIAKAKLNILIEQDKQPLNEEDDSWIDEKVGSKEAKDTTDRINTHCLLVRSEM